MRFTYRSYKFNSCILKYLIHYEYIVMELSYDELCNTNKAHLQTYKQKYYLKKERKKKKRLLND